jgi:hypothetical protein
VANGQPKPSANGQAPQAGNPAAAPASPPGERDAGGRFLPGNKGGPGNPFARRVGSLRKAFSEAVDAGKLQRLAEALYAQAAAGDVAAAALLLKYVLGRPAEAVDPDALDLHEYGLLARRPDTDELAKTLLKKDAALASEAAAGFGPKDAAQLLKDVIGSLRAKLRAFDPDGLGDLDDEFDDDSE